MLKVAEVAELVANGFGQVAEGFDKRLFLYFPLFGKTSCNYKQSTKTWVLIFQGGYADNMSPFVFRRTTGTIEIHNFNLDEARKYSEDSRKIEVPSKNRVEESQFVIRPFVRKYREIGLGIVCTF